MSIANGQHVLSGYVFFYFFDWWSDAKLSGPMLAVLGRSWGLSWRSLAVLAVYVGGRGPKNAKNMSFLNACLFPERERDLRPGGRSWVVLRAYVGGLGPLLEPMLAVLGPLGA